MEKWYRKNLYTVLSAVVAVCLSFMSGCAGGNKNPLDAKIDLALKTLENIELSTENHPWEVMHGIYLFGTDYEILDVEQNKNVNALRNVCCMPTAEKFIQVDEFGPMFADEVDEHEADTHRNMFLSILSAADVPLYHQFFAHDGNVYPLWRFLDKAMLEIDMEKITESAEVLTGNYGNELGWTLSAFSKYLPLDHRWKNKNGKWVTQEDILAAAIAHPHGWGTCFGTHELYGIAAAVRLREDNNYSMPGAWAAARKYLDSAADLVKKNQNPDGSVSREWFTEKKQEKNKRYSIYATGHTLEWLVLALPPEKLQEPWVENMVVNLADNISGNFDSINKSHSISTHAGHALVVYREKIKH